MFSEHDWAAANAAIFYQALLALRRVDLKRKRLAAMRTNDLCFVDQFHFRPAFYLDASPLTSAPKRPLVTPFLIERNKARRR